MKRFRNRDQKLFTLMGRPDSNAHGNFIIRSFDAVMFVILSFLQCRTQHENSKAKHQPIFPLNEIFRLFCRPLLCQFKSSPLLSIFFTPFRLKEVKAMAIFLRGAYRNNLCSSANISPQKYKSS